MTTPTADCVITGPRAADLAGISYRQLDHWARKGWVQPSTPATGRSSRRLYSVDDVVRLRLVAHVGRAGWPLTTLGPELAALQLDEVAFVVVTPDSGILGADSVIELLELLTTPRQVSVFDVTAARQRLDAGAEASDGDQVPARRTA